MTHMQGGVINIIEGLNECYTWTAAGVSWLSWCWLLLWLWKAME